MNEYMRLYFWIKGEDFPYVVRNSIVPMGQWQNRAHSNGGVSEKPLKTPEISFQRFSKSQQKYEGNAWWGFFVYQGSIPLYSFTPHNSGSRTRATPLY